MQWEIAFIVNIMILLAQSICQISTFLKCFLESLLYDKFNLSGKTLDCVKKTLISVYNMELSKIINCSQVRDTGTGTRHYIP